jgi:TetR/AcrR family transcriptional regulator, mexJK operon transcriptional repressor
MNHPPEVRHDAESPKRQAVIEAAGDLFIAQGYGAVSMDAIARAAGVSKATLYAHFASKDALFATIINQACQRHMVITGLLPEPCGDLATALTALGQQLLRFLLDPGALAIHRVVVAESVRFPELGRAFYENGPEVFRRTFAAWLDAQVVSGRLAVPDALMAADQFVGMLRTPGVFLRASLGLPPPPSDAEIDATVAAAVRTFLRGYAAG